MPDFLKKLLTSGLGKAIALKLLRHLLTGLGGALLTWLAAHNADPTQATEFVQYAIGALMAAAGMGLAALDAKKVDTKIKTSADAGAAIVQDAVRDAQLQGEDVQRAADQARADAVKTAIAVADKKAKDATVDDVLAAMRAGGA